MQDTRRPRFGGSPVASAPRFGGTRIDPLDRSMGQRFGENIVDAGWRSALGHLRRAADPAQDGLLNVKDLTAVRYAPLDRALDRQFGEDRGGWFEAAPRTYESLGGTFGSAIGGQGLRGTNAAASERARRERYEDRAQRDPISNPGDALSYFSGQLVGAAPSPENWAGGGAARGVGLAARLGVRAAEQAGIAAGADIGLQALDVGSGVQDRYSPTQTAVAGLVGGTLGPTVDLAAPVAGRAVGGAARRAARFGGQLVEQPASFLRSALANPLPEFDGSGMDTGAILAGEPAGAASRRPGRPSAPRADSPVQRPEIDVPQALRPAFSRASQESGVSGDYLARLARRESSFNPAADAPTSSARGLFQFTEGTWLGTLRRHGERLGLPDIEQRIAANPAAVLRLRDDPDLSARAAALLTRDNAASLARVLGREPNNGELYSAHFLGEAGARKLATSDADARAADLFPEAAAANRSIFYAGNRPRTVAEVRAKLAEGFAGAGGAGGAVDAPRIGQTAPEASPFVAQTLERAPLSRKALGIDEPPPPRGAGEPAAPPLRSEAFARVLDDAAAARPLREAKPDAAPPVRQGVGPDATGRVQDAPVPERLAVSGTPRFGGELVAQAQARGAAPTQTRPRFGKGKLPVDLSQYGDRIGQPLPSSGQAQPGGLREAPRPGAVARGQGADFAGKTVSDLANDLRATLGLTTRQGRVGARGALGTYDRGSGVIRTKAVDELDVLAHEATHHLEFERQGPALAQAFKAHAKELKALDYDPMQSRRHEGFAEFGRWYVTNPTHARKMAPGFYDAFEKALASDSPEILSGLRAVQEGYQNLLSSASLDVARSSLAYTGDKGPVRSLVDEVRRRGPGSVVRRLVDKLYTALVDDLHPLAVAERELGKLYLANKGQTLDLKRAASPYAIARLSREAYAAGHTDLMKGVTPYHGLDPEGPSLADALEKANLAKDRLGEYADRAREEFDAYLISRRAVHLWDRYARGDLPNPPDRNTRQFHEQVIADAEAANPSWFDAAALAYEFQNNLWRKKFEAGLITRESYENGLTHVDYVPWQRDMSDKGPGGKLGRPRGALQFAGGVQALEGSTRDIISPLSSIMREAYALNALIRKNDALKALDDLAQKAGAGAGAFVERLPAKQIEAVNVNAEQALRATAEELGVTGRDLSTLQQLADDAAANETTLTLFKQSEFSPRKGEAVVFVWRDGKKTPLLLADGEFGQEMFRALTGLNQYLRNVVVETMAAGTQLLRYGVTLSPEFMGANLVRDALATWINTDVGFVPGLDTIRGGAKVLARGQTADRYAAAGGMRGGRTRRPRQSLSPRPTRKRRRSFATSSARGSASVKSRGGSWPRRRTSPKPQPAWASLKRRSPRPSARACRTMKP